MAKNDAAPHPELIAVGGTVAILLAGGASTRMEEPKALMPLESGMPAVCHLALLYEKFCGRCLVVTGYHGDLVEQALASYGCGYSVRNPHPERGQLSSLQCALAALAAEPEPPAWFLFAPVDCFDIDALLLDALGQRMATASHETLLCLPQVGEKHGHPVAVRWTLSEEFLALGDDDTARSVVRRHREDTEFVVVKSQVPLMDYDTPEDWRKRLDRLRGEIDTP